MKTCFGYIRVSTQKQGQGVSLDAQRDAIQAFADRNFLNITKWFEEKETAAKSGRPIFNDMLKQLKNGTATALIMHKIDRSARNLRDWLAVRDLHSVGVTVHTSDGMLDFNTRGGRLSANFQAVIAEDYIFNLQEETRKGMDGRLKQGFLPWNAPIGYNNNGGGKFKTPDPERAPFIRLAFELYATQEYSFRRLLTELQNRGFRNRSGKLISKGCLENIMSNPFYHGLIRIKCSGDVYQGGHEPLIPEALFSRVQDIKANKQIKKSTLHNHPFRHLIKCSQCARSLIGERQKAHVYYRCHTKGCAASIREDRLEAAVAAKLMELGFSDKDKENLAGQAEKLLENHSQQDEHQAVRIQLGKVAERLDQLTDALLDQLIDKPTFQNRKATLLKEQASLQNCLREQVSAGDKQVNVRKYLELIKSLHLTYGLASSPQKRRIADLAMSNFLIEEKTLYFKPRKWLCDPRNTVGVLYGAHCPDRTRILADLEAAFQEINNHTISDDIA